MTENKKLSEVSLNYFFLLFFPLSLLPYWRIAFSNERRCNSLNRNGGATLKWKWRKKGTKKHSTKCTNVLHYSKNKSGCSCICSLKANSETTFFLVRKLKLGFFPL